MKDTEINKIVIQLKECLNAFDRLETAIEIRLQKLESARFLKRFYAYFLLEKMLLNADSIIRESVKLLNKLKDNSKLSQKYMHEIDERQSQLLKYMQAFEDDNH